MSDDWDFDETEELGEDEPFPPLQYEIVNYPADTTLKGYLDLFDKDQVEIPEFQRAYVWDVKRASKLVESFLLGLPVPGVFLYKPRSETKYKIVDGQQRIESVVRFQRGIFGERRFKLVGVESRYEGKTFNELDEEDRFRLEGAVLRATIIQQLNPKDDSSIYQIFERLNTGGMNLNPMEVRQAVSYKPAVKALKEANQNEAWRALIGKPNPDKRLQDVELILRVISLAEFRGDYEKPMKGFLNESMEKLRGDDTRIAGLTERFIAAAESVRASLGDRPFHVRGRLNYGALDSILVAAMEKGGQAITPDAYARLRNTKEYLDAIFYNTSDSTEVHKRIELAVDATD